MTGKQCESINQWCPAIHYGGIYQLQSEKILNEMSNQVIFQRLIWKLKICAKIEPFNCQLENDHCWKCYSCIQSKYISKSENSFFTKIKRRYNFFAFLLSFKFISRHNISSNKKLEHDIKR